MLRSGSETADKVEWARRVNNHWIVRHGLKDTAEAYLNHLESVDPARLVLSCRRADQMVHACPAGQDPKPWFYAGLFSLTTADEATRFLTDHWFTAACIPTLPASLSAQATPEHLGAETQAKLTRIRRALTELKNNT